MESMVAAKDAKPHVVFLPGPGMGHMIPFMELAKRLVASHGITVSFLVITTDASPAQNQFFQSPTIPSQIQIVNIPPADMSNVVADEISTPMVARVCLVVQESLKPIRSILVDINPTALVIDFFTSQAIDAANELSIPVYSFYTASASFLAFSLFLPQLDREVEGDFMGLLEPIKVPGCRAERVEDLMDPARNRKRDDYKWCVFHCSRMILVDGILENSWEDLEPVSLKAMRDHDFYKSISTPPVYSIGPLIKPDESISTEQDSRIISWLDNQPPDSVLLVAFGSGGTLTSEQLTELAWGLEMSGERFILVVRKPSDYSASAAYFSVGNENDPSLYLPEGFMRRTEGLGLVVPSWAPQATILGHESTGAFLSHCGWNSTLESISHGVPILGLPLYAEQRMTATLLAEEVGVALKPVVPPGKSAIGREEISRVVRLILKGEEGRAMRSKAKLLKKSAEKAVKHGGSSYESVSRVVGHWKSNPRARAN